MKRKHKINENYFEKIDSEKKAYLLGFIFSDGCVQVLPSASALTASQMEKDADILENLKKELDSDYPLLEIKIKGTDEKKINFYAYSKKLCEDLVKLGVTPRKSLTLQFPKYLDKQLVRHFIRGYFDGDGCIWNGKRKKMIVKDKAKNCGFRERIVHNVKFTFTGLDSFIQEIQNILINEIGISKTKLNFSKAKNPNNNTTEHVCSMEYCGRKNVNKLFHFLYDDATIFGKRKFNKFKEILCAFDEKSSNETGLTAGTPLEP